MIVNLKKFLFFHFGPRSNCGRLHSKKTILTEDIHYTVNIIIK